MRKLLIIVSALLLAFNLQLLGDPRAYAATMYDDLADGTYTFDTKTLTANTDEQSAAQSFLGKSVTLTVQGEQALLTVEVPSNPMANIDWMKIQGAEPVKVEGDKWTYQLQTIEEILQAEIEYQVPALNMEHVVSFRFVLEGLDQLPKQETPEVEEPEIEQPEPEEKPEQPEAEPEEQPETKPEEKPEQPEQPETKPEEQPTLANGYYHVPGAFLHETEDKPSSMSRYLDDNVFVHVEEKQPKVTITVNDHETVTKLQVNGQDAVSAKLDGNKRIETFNVDNPNEPFLANVAYQAPYNGSVHHGTASFRISLDVKAAKEASANDQPGADITAEYVQLADGLYAMDASFINVKNGQDSAMARYLDELAYVDVKDGKAVVYVHILDNGTVTKVQVNGTEAVEEITNGDEALVGFNLDAVLTELAGYAEYQAPFGDSIHYGKADFNIELDRNTVKAVDALPIEQEEAQPEQPEEKPEQPEEQPEEKPEEQPEEQVTTIDYVIQHETENQVSSADRFFEKPAKVVKENGKTYLELTITSWSMIDTLEVKGKAVKVLKEDKKADTALVKFEVPNNLSTIVPLSMKVTVPGLYEMTHAARLVMDDASLEETTPEEKPETKPEEQPEEKPELTPEPKPEGKPEQPKEEDKGQFSTIDYVIKHATVDEASAADNFFVKPAKMVKENGKTYLEVTITSWSMIGSLKVDGKAVKVLKEDKKADTALVKFEVPNNLSTILPLSMQVTVPGLYDTTHEARLVMDPQSLVDGGTPGKPGIPSKPTVPGQKPSLEKPNKPEKVDPNASKAESADQAFNLDYVIKHATADEVSAADNFFVKPGVLLKKNGQHYLQVKVNSWSMIDWLTVNGQSVTVIQEDKKADTATIQFAVPKDLSEIVQLSMKVTVPGLYETVHEARLVMNEKSLKEIADHKDFQIYTNGGMGGNGSIILQDEDPLQKPSFGTNETNQENVKPSTVGGQSNPQTGDKSMIILYTVLLLVSSTLLFVRFRKHQVNE